MKIRVLIVILITLALFVQTVPLSNAQCLFPLVRAKPDSRGGHSMTFDPHNGVAMIFGGTSFDGGIHSLRDTLTYSYASNQWAELVCTSSPPARSNHAMVYCNQTNEIILCGGFGVTDTWSFDCATQTWFQVVTPTNPGVHHSLALAYDPQENVVILFGGFGDDGWTTDDT